MASRAKATLTPLTAEQRSDIKETFALFDIDGNGFMDAGDLAVAMQALGCEPRREELRRLLDEADPEGTGSIPYDVFYKLMVRVYSERDATDDLIATFRLFDTDGTGVVTLDTLRRVAAELGEPLSEAEAKQMIKEADSNGDGAVTQADFVRLMLRSNRSS